MFPGSHNAFKVHGGKTIFRSIAYPKISLAVGRDELLNPINGGPELRNPVRPTYTARPVQDDYQLAAMKLGRPLSVSNFPREHYQGEGLE